MNIVSVFSLYKKFAKLEAKTKKVALKVLKILRQKNVSLDVYFVSNKEASALNRKFRGKKGATNILSFGNPKGFIELSSKKRAKRERKKLGEIYINIEKTADYRPPRIAKQGLSQDKWTTNKRLFSVDRLLAHGILHLLGYSHKKNNDRKKMEKIEEELMERF